MNWFSDSSALVKRYVSEHGSKWLRHEISRHDVVIAQVTLVEVVAALRKRFRQGDLSEFACYQARKRFITHIVKRQFRVIEISSEIVDEAMRIAFDKDLRAYDAVQLSSALAIVKTVDKGKLIFITADANLEKRGVPRD